MTLRVVVAEDEVIARRHLIRLLAAHPEISIIAQPCDGIEALAAIQSTAPDAVFLDIQMPGLDAFAILQHLVQQPFIVFTTAHDEYALSAFQENTVDYLLKPISPEDLSRAVKKLLARSAPPGTNASYGPSVAATPPSSRSTKAISEVLRHLRETISTPPQLLVSIRDTFRPIRHDQIVLLQASDKSTLIHTVDQVLESQNSLSELQTKLPASEFIRIHRRHLVNRRFIRALQRWGNRQLRVELTVPFAEELLVSRRCYDDVILRFGGDDGAGLGRRRALAASG